MPENPHRPETTQATAQRIVICCHDFSRGGTERIAIGLAKAWADAGRDVVFLVGSVEGGLRDAVDPRVEVHELSPPIPRSLTSRLRLGSAMGREIAQLNPDIIFLPGNFHLHLSFALSRARAAQASKAAIVFKISNPITPHGPTAPLLRALIRRFRHCVDGVAAMNSGLERDMLTIAPDVAVQTLYDPTYFQRAPAAERAPPDGVFHIVWAGRLEPQKDAMLALRTILTLRERWRAERAFHMTMLGTGRQREMIEQAVVQMGLSDIVTLAGHVPSVDSWLVRSDVLLVTSRYEGGPAVAVEALAHGVPVVSTDCSHLLHDIMTIPEAGRIVASRTPNDLSAALIDMAGADQFMPDALFKLVAHLDADRCAKAYLAWFDGVAARRRCAV